MNLGMPEMIFIFLLALILFGPKKLPEIGREIGKALAEFKRASNDFKNQLESEIDKLDVEKQRDYYRNRAAELAREAQSAFSVESLNKLVGDEAPVASAQPSATPYPSAYLPEPSPETPKAAESKPSDDPASTYINPATGEAKSADTVKGTNV